MIHVEYISPEEFEKIKKQNQTFYIQSTDSNAVAGDIIIFNEWEDNHTTGRYMFVEITSTQCNGLICNNGYSIVSFIPCCILNQKHMHFIDIPVYGRNRED